MTRVVTAAALIALTLFAWDVPDCPFCAHAAKVASHSTDNDFFFLEPEKLAELFAPAPAIVVAVERPSSVDVSWAPLTRAPKQGPPGA